jgi:hypothetical protein
MKKLLTITLTAALLAISGCEKYDDSALWSEVSSQSKRLAALEAWQATVNGNITALQELVNALQNQRYITDVSAFATPAPGGYTISFNTGACNTNSDAGWQNVLGSDGQPVPATGNIRSSSATSPGCLATSLTALKHHSANKYL